MPGWQGPATSSPASHAPQLLLLLLLLPLLGDCKYVGKSLGTCS